MLESWFNAPCQDKIAFVIVLTNLDPPPVPSLGTAGRASLDTMLWEE